MNMTINEQKQFLENENKIKLKDKVLNAFESLSHDFDIYQEISYNPVNMTNQSKHNYLFRQVNPYSRIEKLHI